jgi:hypothetical protein
VSWVVDEVARRCGVLMSFVAMKDNNNTVCRLRLCLAEIT